MSGYAFHPDAFADLDEIWEYIAQDNCDAADQVLADIDSVLGTWRPDRTLDTQRPDLTTRPLRFHVARHEYLVGTHHTRSRFGSSRFFAGGGIRG
jgi:plasmid stabilization system protein ParE